MLFNDFKDKSYSTTRIWILDRFLHQVYLKMMQDSKIIHINKAHLLLEEKELNLSMKLKCSVMRMIIYWMIQ